MKVIILFCLSFLLALGLQAQPKSQTIEVKSGDVLSDIVSEDFQYAFDEFTDGSVMYKNGTVGTSKLNYNYLLGAMEFIDPSQNNEVLALINTADILMVIINKRQFLPAGTRNEFMEVLVRGDDVYLAVNRKGKSYKMGTEGAYGIVSATASTSSVSRMASSGGDVGTYAPAGTPTSGTDALTVKQNVRVSMENSYYLYSNGKSTYIKNEKTFTKVYPKDKVASIEKYLADNKINFNSEADLIKLTEYCNKL